MIQPDKTYRDGRLKQSGAYLTYVNAAVEEERMWRQISMNQLGLNPKEYMEVAVMAVQAPHTDIVIYTVRREEQISRRTFRVRLGGDVTLDDRLFSTVEEIRLEVSAQPN